MNFNYKHLNSVLENTDNCSPLKAINKSVVSEHLHGLINHANVINGEMLIPHF
jgi:hypothetical protein